MSGLRASLCARWQPRQLSKDTYEAEHGAPRSSSAGTSQDTIKASTVKSIVANSNNSAVERPTGFLDLPLELRQKIYDLALPREHNTTEIPALLRCNLQICREVTALSTPVLKTTFAGGYDCDWPDQDRKMSNMRAFAARAQRLVSEGREPKVRIMVECSGSYNKLILKPLLEVIDSTPGFHVEVVPHPVGCPKCHSRYPTAHGTATANVDVTGIEDLIRRVESLRGNGFMKATVIRNDRPA